MSVRTGNIGKLRPTNCSSTYLLRVSVRKVHHRAPVGENLLSRVVAEEDLPPPIRQATLDLAVGVDELLEVR